MNKNEFRAIVDDAVKNGADRKDAEAYVRAGFKVDEKAEGAETLSDSKSAGSGSPKKRATSKEKKSR